MIPDIETRALCKSRGGRRWIILGTNVGGNKPIIGATSQVKTPRRVYYQGFD